ncbi:MAG: response regulator transcription factor [Dehalococcoidia bacterium]
MSAPLADSLMPTAGFIPFFEADFRAAAEWHLQAFMAPGRGSPISELAAEWERLWSRTTFCRLAELNETASLRETLPGVNVPVLLMGPPAGWGEDLERTASLHPGARIAYTSGYPIDAAAGREFREVCKGFWSAAGLSNDVPADAPRPDRSLSSREEEVLRLLAEGKANKEIAAALSLSQATVASHVRHVLEKTGSANRAQAVAWAIRNGLI